MPWHRDGGNGKIDMYFTTCLSQLSRTEKRCSFKRKPTPFCDRFYTTEFRSHSGSSDLLCKLHQSSQINTLRPLNWETQCSVPNQLCQWSQPTAHTKGHGVVKRISEP